MVYRGLAYKEWIKLRWALLAVGLVSIATIAYLLVAVRELFEFAEPIKVWESAIHRKVLVYSPLKYNALIAGVAFGLVQFVPETTKRRLRLLFHLPVDHNRSLAFMLAAGLSAVLAVILVNAAGLLWAIAGRYPAECVASSLVTAAPWFLAGIAAYFGTALSVVEPVWWRKAAYALLGFALVKLCFGGLGYDTYAEALWKYAILTALFLPAVFLPAFRFKRGIDR